MTGAPGTARRTRSPAVPDLDISVVLRREGFTLDVATQVGPGEILAVIGANGSGKSTLLGAIAGSQRIDSGHVRLGTRVLTRRIAGEPHEFLRRPERRVGLLDQRALLFPHLDARANVAFGPQARGHRRRVAAELADEWLARVGLLGRGGARARDLSGGQQQRVAIARTLAAEPEILLLDEPFAALDVTSRAELRNLIAAEARRLRIPVVIVSHDLLDLIALADHVMVMESGRAAQNGTLSEVLAAPLTPFAAAFTGRSLLVGAVSAAGHLRVAGAPIPELRGQRTLSAPGSPAVASFDPRMVRVTPSGCPAETPRSPTPNTWRGTIGAVSSELSGMRITCAEWPQVASVLPLARAFEAWIVPGAAVTWQIPESAVNVAVAPAGDPDHPQRDSTSEQRAE